MQYLIIFASCLYLAGCVTGSFESGSESSGKSQAEVLEAEDEGLGKPVRNGRDETRLYPENESELDMALRRLIDDLELAVMGMASEDEKKERTHYVESGEYLDLIIEKTMPNSPVQANLLRKAFVQLNPNSFGGDGNPNYLFAKTRLKIPSVEDLKKIIFKDTEMEELKVRSRDPYRGWIQYP